jgi:hypothetical protein
VRTIDRRDGPVTADALDVDAAAARAVVAERTRGGTWRAELRARARASCRQRDAAPVGPVKDRVAARKARAEARALGVIANSLGHAVTGRAHGYGEGRWAHGTGRRADAGGGHRHVPPRVRRIATEALPQVVAARVRRRAVLAPEVVRRADGSRCGRGGRAAARASAGARSGLTRAKRRRILGRWGGACA